MKIQITAGELSERGLWEDACEILELNPWVINEGRMNESEELTLTEEQAIQLGLLPGKREREDEEI